MDIESNDWQTIEILVTDMRIKQCHWTTKFTTGFCAMGCMMHRWGKHTSAVFPCCRQTRNHGPHSAMPRSGSTGNWRSKHPRTKNTSKRTRTNLTQQLLKTSAKASMHGGLISLPLLCSPIWENFISWDNFSPGFLAIAWHTHQANFYTDWQLRHSSTKMSCSGPEMGVETCQTTMGSPK